MSCISGLQHVAVLLSTLSYQLATVFRIQAHVSQGVLAFLGLGGKAHGKRPMSDLKPNERA